MRTTEVAVVGAGLAGVSAALAAARSGVHVTLIDEWNEPGGGLRWSLARIPHDAGMCGGQRGCDVASTARQELTEAGVTVVQNGVAWGLFEDKVIGVVTDAESFQVQAERIVLATGATDVTAPFPGWELPGVMTGTAVQRFMHEHRVLPGRSAAVVGDGSWAAEVRDALSAAGVSVTVSSADAYALHAGGDGRVEWVAADGERSFVDCVVLAMGRQPDPELALHALCEIGFSELDRAWVPLRSETLETSVPGLYVAGDSAGICSVAEAVAEGRVAGLAAISGIGLDEALVALATSRSAERAAEIARLRLPIGSGAVGN